MKEQAKDFGTSRQWKTLGSDITILRGKLESLDVKIDEVHRKSRELVNFIDTVKLLTFTAIILVMLTLLLNHWNI